MLELLAGRSSGLAGEPWGRASLWRSGEAMRGCCRSSESSAAAAACFLLRLQACQNEWVCFLASIVGCMDSCSGGLGVLVQRRQEA